MSKTISRRCWYYFIVAIGAYTTCFFLLWTSVGNQSFKEFSKDQFLFKSSITIHSAKNKDKTHAASGSLESCTNGNCARVSSTVKMTQLNFNEFNRTYNSSKKYFLTEILMARIYKNDLAKWTINELKQWLHFLFYAGVEHVYLCDHFVYHHERLDSSLSKYIENELITYIEWPWNASNNGGKIMRHQVNCYSHVIKKYGKDSMWQMSIDMDEFPVCLKDTERLYLVRYLLKQSANVSQILMPNFLMLGQGNRSKTMTIEKITRITKKVANALTKPLYKISAIRHPGIHSHYLNNGVGTTADPDILRMLHYWGARLQNWGPDTNKTIEMTEEFDLIKDTIAPAVRRSLNKYGEHDVFSNSTGP